MKKGKKKIGWLILALLLCSAFILRQNQIVRADGWDDPGSGGGGSTSNLFEFDDHNKLLQLVTSVQTGSTAANRIRSIGWYVTITTTDGRSASAIFETSGDSGSYFGYASYNFNYGYIVSEFKSDAGAAGESIARDFLYGTGASGGGTIQMWAYFTWWQSGYSPDSNFNINGSADNVPGAVSGHFKGDPINSTNAPVNYTPANVGSMFERNPDWRFDGLAVDNGVATTETAAEVIPTVWGGTMDLHDYYPATGSKAASTIASNDLSISLKDMGTYRVNTDVFVSAIVTNTGEADIPPSDQVNVHLSIPGVADQTKQLIVPHQDSQLVYFKIHTPAQAGNISISVNVNDNHAVMESDYSNNTAGKTVYVYGVAEQTPPDPQLTDRKDPYFYIAGTPDRGTQTSTSWGVWNFVNNSFEYDSYQASISNTLSLTPDMHCPTATNQNGKWQMKSGYGFTEGYSVNVTGSFPADTVTGPQLAVSYYPEFYFGSYNRIMEPLTTGLNALFDLKQNPYSQFGSHVHFTPVWFPDGDYTVQALCLDVWTPAGMLSSTATGTIGIKGSVFDDYYVKPGY